MKTEGSIIWTTEVQGILNYLIKLKSYLRGENVMVNVLNVQKNLHILANFSGTYSWDLIGGQSALV